MRRLTVAICLALIGVSGWLFSDRLPLKREVTVYLGWCPQPLVAGACASGEEAANPTTYRADASSQVVVYWSEGQAPSRLQDCAVRDAVNWACGAFEAARVSMVEGKLSEAAPPMSAFYQVSKAKWLWLDLHTKRF